MENVEAPPAGPRFVDLGLIEPVLRAVQERGYEHPTPVQAAVFQPATSGKDCVVQARTGTGKTAAFGLPLISARVQSATAQCQALILCPTRELALQVARELESLAKYTETRVVSIYGGAPMTRQIEQLQQGAHIVVGTPGRVLDHLRRKTLNVGALRSFVLDECDEMLSMGFLPQINDIWACLPQGHQTLLFSATMPKEVTRVAESRLRSPEFITLSGDQIGALEIQHFFYLSHGNKGQELLQLIEYENPESAIVFCNTRDETKRIAKILQDNGYAAEWLNADLGQSDRENVMRQTRASELRFLVCTDVAARGIDISHLTHVINADFPDNSEQYVHRTGRTGRAGRIGTALSLVSPGAIGDLYYLRLKYKIHPIERHLPTREELLAREEADILRTLGEQAASRKVTSSYLSLARRMLTEDNALSLVASLLASQLGNGEEIRSRAVQARKVGKLRPVAARDAAADTVAADGAPRDERREAAPRMRGPKTESAARPERREERKDEVRRDDVRRDDVRRDDARRPARDAFERGPRRAGPRREARNFDAEVGIGYQVSDLPGGSAEAAISAPAVNLDGPETAAVESAAQDATPNDVNASSYVSLFMSVGRRDGARTEDVEGALNEAGVAATDTGRISVKLNHTFIEVRPEAQNEVIERLSGREICGRTAHVELARAR